MLLPELPNYISVPDYYPHCEICGYRGLILGDFLHTNYKGAIYECISCDKPRLFVDQEDEYFSINYWNMNQTNRSTYTRLPDNQKRVFNKMSSDEQKTYLKMKAKSRKLHMNSLMAEFYI